VTVDLTGLACSVIAGFFGLLSVLLPLIVSARMKDQQAADALTAAVRNALGAMQQSSTLTARTLGPHVVIPGVPAGLQPGVQYVLDHAGTEAIRLGVSPEKIAEKILAQVGLTQIQTNQAVASSAVSVVPDPLGPVPVQTGLGIVGSARPL
jgi:hypothetical protein